MALFYRVISGKELKNGNILYVNYTLKINNLEKIK